MTYDASTPATPHPIPRLSRHVGPSPDLPAALGSRPFTTAEARSHGLTGRDLRALVRSGALRHVAKRVYVESGAPDTIDLRVACLRLVVPPRAVVCDRHAAWLHGAEMVLAPGEALSAQPLRVLRRRGSPPLRNGLVDGGERDLTDEDVVDLDGLAVTSPLRTCWDLGMVRWPSEALAGMNALYRTGRVDKGRLLAGLRRFTGRRWVTTLRAVAPLVHGGCESPPEDILWLRCLEAGIELSPQVELWDTGAFVARFDLADEALKFAVEYDGREWHSSPEQLEHDRRRRARAEALGWIIVVVRAEDLFSQNPRAGELIAAGHRAARVRAGLPAYAVFRSA